MTCFFSAVTEATPHLDFPPSLLYKSWSRSLTLHYSLFPFPLFTDPLAGLQALNSFCPTWWGWKGPGGHCTLSVSHHQSCPCRWNRSPVTGTFWKPGQGRIRVPLSWALLSAPLGTSSIWALEMQEEEVRERGFSVSFLPWFPFCLPWSLLHTPQSVFCSDTHQKLLLVMSPRPSLHRGQWTALCLYLMVSVINFEAGILPNFKVACLASGLPGGSSQVCFSDSAPEWLLNLDFLGVQAGDLPLLFSLCPLF